jgi:dihydrolipoamide dehydrogenase
MLLLATSSRPKLRVMRMRQYDLIVIGSGSAMNIVEPMIQENPKIKIAVIDKDEPGGICLTRGCIPSKILLYPAELVRTLEKAKDLGVNAEIKKIDFSFIMGRMKSLLSKDIEAIREGLSNSPNIDYFHAAAEFVSPYTLKLAGEKAGDSITAKMIFLCIGSTTIIPPIEGLEKTGYLTSDTVLNLTSMPKSISIVGGGYIAAEYGHFFSSMGSKVTIIGRNPQFLPEEEPEISEIAMKELGNHMKILTDHEVKAVMRTGDGQKRVSAIDRESGKNREVNSEEIMIAAGRGPITEVLHPERGGIRTSKEGWIQVNEYFETSQPNVWAFGDADGRYPFKHVANYESEIVYYNAVLK